MSTVDFLQIVTLVLIGIGILATIVGRSAYILDRLVTRVTFGEDMLEQSRKVAFATALAIFVATAIAFYTVIFQDAPADFLDILIFFGGLLCVVRLMKFTGYFASR